MKDDREFQDIVSRELDVRAGDRTYNRMRQVVLDVHESSKQKPSAARLTIARRIIMKSRFAKVAAAAVIIIAVLIGLNPFGPTVTFADVVEPILNAKTMIFDVIIGGDESGTTIHDIVVGPRIRRTMSNLPNLTQILDLDSGKLLVVDSEPNLTQILDLDSGKVLVLDSEAKKAMYMDIEGPGVTGTRDYLAAIQEIIELVQNDQDSVEELGEQVIDGQKAIVFVARGPNGQITIWADPKTALPIRIEIRIGQEITTILKNFEFDATVDDALVSMDIPDGYNEQKAKAKAQFELREATEQDFVESLRIWAEIARDGTFPDAVGSENAMKAIPTLVQKLTQMQLSEEEVTKNGIAFGRGMAFHQMVSGRGEWHYAGAGVKLGDAATAIFWYPSGSDTYRVIYGDLSVKDIAEADLPK